MAQRRPDCVGLLPLCHQNPSEGKTCPADLPLRAFACALILLPLNSTNVAAGFNARKRWSITTQNVKRNPKPQKQMHMPPQTKENLETSSLQRCCVLLLHLGQAYSITGIIHWICIDYIPQLPRLSTGSSQCKISQLIYQAHKHSIHSPNNDQDSRQGLNFPGIEALYSWNTQHQGPAICITVLHSSLCIPYVVCCLSYHCRSPAPQDDFSSGELQTGENSLNLK